MTRATIKIPPKLIPVFEPARGDVRYRGAYGGRGSAKSYTFALMAAVWGYAEPLRILCTREFQASIKESFHAELKRVIESEPWLAANYDLGVDYLRGHNGTEFIFKGLRRNIQSIKSLAQIDLCIIEEAEDVPEASWRDLVPTVRSDKSEIWCIWNPRNKDSPVDKRFIQKSRNDAVIAEVNYQDNPWFPAVLEAERKHDLETMDPATYAHVWGGKYLEVSELRIFADKIVVDEFEPAKRWDGPYFGVDYGFANDPTTANKCWVHDNTLYVEYEANKVGLELDATAEYLIDRVPGIEDHVARADNARPETTSYLQRSGLPRLRSADKWPGSVLDGIKHLRSYKQVVIHPRCRETIKEGRLYSWRVDKLTGDIKPEPEDAHNHHWDDIRYALQPLIKRKKKRSGVW